MKDERSSMTSYFTFLSIFIYRWTITICRNPYQFMKFKYVLDNKIVILLTFKWSWLTCLCITCFGLGRWALTTFTSILGLLSYCSCGFSLSWTTGFGASSPWRPIWPLTINYDEKWNKINIENLQINSVIPPKLLKHL